MKDKSAIRKIYDPENIPLSARYHTLAKKTEKLIQQYLAGKDCKDIDALDEIINIISERTLEEITLNYTEGFKLGLALGFESASDIFS